jgi:hypothetical protein
MKQETTLEEAKNNAWDNYEYVEGNLYSTSFKNGFELGAKWQQERSYSEEEVFDILASYARWRAIGDCTYSEWIEKWKKK